MDTEAHGDRYNWSSAPQSASLTVSQQEIPGAPPSNANPTVPVKATILLTMLPPMLCLKPQHPTLPPPWLLEKALLSDMREHPDPVHTDAPSPTLLARYQVPAHRVPRAMLSSPCPRESHPSSSQISSFLSSDPEDKEMIQSLLILGCLRLGNSWITIHHIDLPISSFLMNSPAVRKNFHPFLNVTTTKLSNVPALEDVLEGD
ncbi:hypothetical protein BDQ17DRAFT_1438212 [Cyathus striatus]|nr:hypothetical protein BDQ17DRAFT_1438212 [Cyathus striatus]